MCFLSIIIPIYNAEKDLKHCLDSFMIQKDSNICEIVLVDDGSTDSSGAICDEYAKNNPEIHVIHQENGGPSKARNTGLEAATGQYACFMDSDDCLEVDALETITSYIKKYNPDILKYGYKKRQSFEEIDISCGKTELITEHWKMLDRTEGTQYCGFVWNSAFRRDCISDIRFREDFNWCEDHLFSFECFRKAKSMLLIPNVLYIYNILDNGLSNVKDPYAVYNMAQTELPIKLSMADGTYKSVEDRIWAEFYGKLNYAVKVLIWHKMSYKYIKAYKKNTIDAVKDITFPSSCNYAHYFYNQPLLISYIILKIKAGLNRILRVLQSNHCIQ